jgi:RHS repeat-associated protein
LARPSPHVHVDARSELHGRLSSGNRLDLRADRVGPTSYGKEQDQLTDLSYYGARYFDPLSLTWTQADPLFRFAPDMAWDQPRRANLYSFSLNNPLRYMDPDGENPFVAVVEGCAANPTCSAAVASAAAVAVATVTGAKDAAVDAARDVADRIGDALAPPTPRRTDPNDEPYTPSQQPRIGEGSAPREDAARTRTGEDFGGPMAPPKGDQASHRKNKRESNRQKHEKGNERRGRDKGGEKGDKSRRPNRKPPPGHKKGPWPPKPVLTGPPQPKAAQDPEPKNPMHHM